MIFGKLIGAVLGFLAFPPFGAVLGLFVGHIFDRGLNQMRLMASPEERQAIQDCFFTAVFRLLGYLAKADGQVSAQEISQAENFMNQMGLTSEHRRKAIEMFNEGKSSDYKPDNDLKEFRRLCGSHRNLVQLLLVNLVNMAMADGVLDQAEERVLKEIASGLGISGVMLDQLLRMIQAQNAFGGGGYSNGSYSNGQYGGGYSGNGSQAANPNTLALAYQALGVSADATDKEVKKAYRRLMSEYHPDKLIGQGVPDDMIQSATERSQEIQRAYDVIKKARK